MKTRLVLLVACTALIARGAAAQQRKDAWDFRGPDLTRAELEQALARYDAAAGSSAYSTELRAMARSGSDSIRSRLRDGDLKVGDLIRLRVEGQQVLTDTFSVSSGPALVLPVVGRIDLGGVLRAELEQRITQSVDSVFRGTPVRVVLLTRLAVLGGVVRPGFFALPSDALLDDAIGAAGGLAQQGMLAGAYIERGSSQVWDSDSLQAAIRSRRTIRSLGLVAGDRIVVPTTVPQDPLRTVQTISYLVSVPLSIYALVKLF